ncbi:FRG domain-containing protein [Hymenobacter sp. BT186]|uniref:FRG domain-containing protein n=1 Tax=Hymenobacter telluris TaxID=2816474 RepID=A0A939JFR9_9BACT|nr:FRG domain-containing protein [Hymenobacter telluris]MBO0360717.1 FRG domain-containing protein [Hymenobacter telluris]MBW3376744.1 FRG domain-containing protein [Hymenobacter norwichensis]
MEPTDAEPLLDLKMKLLWEWGQSGGWSTLRNVQLVRELTQVRAMPDGSGRVDPSTLTSRVRALANAEYGSQLLPPLLHPEHLSMYQSFVQKDNYFDQKRIDTVPELEALITEHASRTDHLYRGINEAKFMLYSSLQRNWIVNRRETKPTDHQAFLERLMDNARVYCGGLLTKYIEANGGDSGNDVSVLSILQHYSCPTPILDWTYSFPVALYFAALGATEVQPQSAREIDNYVSVYYIQEEGFAQAGLREMVSMSIEGNLPLIKQVFQANVEALKQRRGIMASFSPTFSDENMDKFANDDAAALRWARASFPGGGLTNYFCRIEHLKPIPNTYFSDRGDDFVRMGLENNANVINQQGVFTWNSSPTEPMEYIVHQQVLKDNPDANHCYSYCFNIHKSLLPHLRQRLPELGITDAFIFPEQDQAQLREVVWAIFDMTAAEFA